MRVPQMFLGPRKGHRPYLPVAGPALIWLLASLLCLVALPQAAHAITTISQGFFTNDQTSTGSLVSLRKDSSDQVEVSNSGNTNNLLGVVVNDGTSLLTLTSGQARQIQVATSGIVQVLVSDINGTIAQGDPITASPINGVGMKATTSTRIIGNAQEGLSGLHGSRQSYTDKSGQKHSVLLGEVPVLVNVTYFYKQPEKTIIPQALQNVANALAGHPVNAVPILISVGIFIITLIVVVSIVYSMIHSSIISVGRNPMSQSAIYRDLIQLSALVVGILVVSIVAIYLVLTKL